MKTLTPDELLAAGKKTGCKTKRIRVPELDDEDGAEAWVFIRKMRASERDEYDRSIRNDKDEVNTHNWRAKHVALVLCHENGDPFFDAAKVEEFGALIGAWDSDAVSTIHRASVEFSRLDREGAEKGKGNSGVEAGDSSSSGSPSPAVAPTLITGSTASPPE